MPFPIFGKPKPQSYCLGGVEPSIYTQRDIAGDVGPLLKALGYEERGIEGWLKPGGDFDVYIKTMGAEWFQEREGESPVDCYYVLTLVPKKAGLDVSGDATSLEAIMAKYFTAFRPTKFKDKYLIKD